MFADVPPPLPPSQPLHTLVSVRRGHAVALHERPDGPVVARLGWRTPFGSQRVWWVQDSTRPGWAGVQDARTGNRRRLWIRLDPEAVELSGTDYAVAVDLSSRIMRVRHRGRIVERIKVSVGRRESPTPQGSFQVTDRLGGGRFYGCCVIAVSAVQPNLPSGWLGGNRIAIHGSPAPKPVGRAATAGCVRLSERPLRQLFRMLPLGTPVRVHA